MSSINAQTGHSGKNYSVKMSGENKDSSEGLVLMISTSFVVRIKLQRYI